MTYFDNQWNDEDLNIKYETDLKQIRSDVTYKIADLKRETTKQGLNNE